MPPVAAAYTFTPAAGVTELLRAAALDRDEDGDDEEPDAPVGGAFALEQAAAIRASPRRIAAARSEGVVRWGDFTGESIPVAPRDRRERSGKENLLVRLSAGRRAPGGTAGEDRSPRADQQRRIGQRESQRAARRDRSRCHRDLPYSRGRAPG